MEQLFLFVYFCLQVSADSLQENNSNFAFEDDTLKTESLILNSDFDSQVDQLIRWIRWTPDDKKNTRVVIHDVGKALQKCWPGCKLYEFGATVSGLGLKTSDVDLYVDLPEWAKDNNTDVIPNAISCLSHNTAFADLQIFTATSLPVVRFFHVSTKRQCDLNFEGRISVKISKLVYHLLHMDCRVFRLAILVKYWAKLHELKPYVPTLMVIFYLQQLRILPPVSEMLRDAEKHLVHNWNTPFLEDFHFESTNRQPLHELLIGFFSYYKEFQFEELAVSPFLGKPVRKTFLRVETLPEYELYKSLVRNDAYKPEVIPKLCVQDLFVHKKLCDGNNTDEYAEKIFKSINDTASAIQVAERENILRSLLASNLNTTKLK